jgi:hypothetical protein
MAKFTFKDVSNERIIEEFSVSQTFLEILNILQQKYPLIYDIFAFPQEDYELDALNKQFSQKVEQKNNNDLDLLHKINSSISELSRFITTTNINYDRRKYFSSKKLVECLNCFLDVISKRKEFTRKYRLLGMEEGQTFTVGTWNGVIVNGKRVCLEGGIGKCTMSVYDDSGEGYLEISDITSVKMLESNKGIIKVISRKLQVNEIQFLENLLKKLKDFTDDRDILFIKSCY